MKVAITGAPGAGASELFVAVGGSSAQERRSPRIATIKVPDHRVDALTEIWNPKKTIYVEAQFVDLSADSGATADAAKVLGTYDAIALVVQADTTDGAIRSLNDFCADLLLRDQVVIEGRLDRLARQNQKGHEKELLDRALAHLEKNAPLRSLELSDSDAGDLRGFQFVSRMPLLVVHNVEEADAAKELDPAFEAAVKAHGGAALALSVALEVEIAQLEADDQRAFLAEIGLDAPAKDRFLRAAYGLLDLISFLTQGEDECRAWSVRRNAKAPEAGGKVHSDIERGFIRAEVIRFEDFIELRSEAACRKVGKLRVEGKDYVVQDGDILHFRFNV